jgi:hypothetical protein
VKNLSLLILLSLSCAFTKPVSEPQSKPKNEPEFYIPNHAYMSQLACTLGVSSLSALAFECKAVPQMPSWAECLPNYHQEKQVICTTNQSEPTTARTVCHLNVARGYTNLCGMECSMNTTKEQQIIIPPNLDRHEAFQVK